MGRHWFILTVAGFVIGFTVLGLVWLAYRRFMQYQASAPGSRRPLTLWWMVSGGSKEYEMVPVHPA